MNHILSADQFSQSELLDILNQAREMEKVLQKGGSKMAAGKILAALFYEPSTRTRLSFETAMLRLGGSIISETDVHFSSQVKGETLQDTIRIVSSCADIIALRSRNAGDAQLASQYSSVPILNGGDGKGEHPTQAVLDLFTISKYFSFDRPLRIAFVGELIRGRTVHSLSKLLRLFHNFHIIFVAPEVLQIPNQYRKDGDEFLFELNDDVLKNSDIIYDTRIQKERFESIEEFERYNGIFVFDTEKVSKMKPNAILMHPLPRVNEITQDVDRLPQAKYFEQARNGIPVRMALIARVLGI